MMNKDEAGGNWKQFKGKMKEQWGKLTDDDMTVIEGKRDQLVGKIRERYGYQKDQAEKRLLTGKPVTTIAGNMFSPTEEYMDVLPLFAYECGRAPLYCRRFPFRLTWFSSPAPVIVTTVSRMATRFYFYARRAQTVRLNNVMS